MDLVVCFKRTPDTTTRVRVGPDGKSIDPQGVEWIINQYDQYAIEQALQFKEKYGGTVLGVTLDPEGQRIVMTKALAMGVDKGVVIQGGNVYDSFGVARALAETISKFKYDIIFFGKQAIDDDAYAVPSMVATLLGLPRASVVVKMELRDKTALCHRQIEGAEEVVEIPLPCVVSCQRGLNEPRFPQMRGIMMAKTKPVEQVSLSNFESTLELVRLEPPPARPPSRIVANVVGKPPEEIRKASQELIRLLKEEAKIL